MNDQQLHAYDVALSLIIEARNVGRDAPKTPLDPETVGDLVSVLVGMCVGMVKQLTDDDDQRFIEWVAERIEAFPR